LAGGSGIVWDRESGIQILNKDETHVITFENAETIEDVLNLLNASAAEVFATINAAGTGIDVRSRVSGAAFAIGENGGTTASELGIRTFTRETLLEDLNYERGVEVREGTDFIIQRRDGAQLEVDVSGATSIGDVLDLINGHALNVGDRVVARLAEYGNGIALYDDNAGGAAELRVIRGPSGAARDLGLVPRDANEATSQTPELLQGGDANLLETKSVFNSLLRLSEALEDFDLGQLERAAAMLDDDFQRLNFARSDLGARTSTLDAIRRRMESEQVELKTTLSNEWDTDLVEAVSELAARQANMQATLQLIGKSLQLSVLDFL
jgi:flagellar hook-associated protein 3 FlgL